MHRRERWAISFVWAIVAVGYVTLPARVPDALLVVGSIALALFAIFTVGIDVDTPPSRKRRMRLAWDLGCFHIAFVGLLGSTSDAVGFSAFVDGPVAGRILDAAAAILLAYAALRQFDLDGRGHPLIFLRAILAGVAMGVVAGIVIFGAAFLLLPIMWAYAITTGAAWALAFAVFHVTVAGIARRFTIVQ